MQASQPTGNPGEDLLEGDHLLLSAFRSGAPGSLEPGAVLISPTTPAERVYQLRTGLAYRSRDIADGRRAISDIYMPGDIIGLEAVLAQRAPGTVAVAAPARYWAVEAAALRQMMQQSPQVALRVAGVFSEAQRRAEDLAARIARLDAPERVAQMLLDLFERMRRRGILHRPTFNLRLTQQQIGDHLGLSGVHVNRVLRWMARERIAFVQRQVVIINDLGRLRALARGEPIPPRQRRAVTLAPVASRQTERRGHAGVTTTPA